MSDSGRDGRHPGLFVGRVVDRDDPEGLGRVRVCIPGLIEPASAWAFPLGTVGGGSAARGFFSVPEVVAECGVLFNRVDVDAPFFMPGHWGKPGGQSEAPTPVKAASGSADVRAFETGRFLMTFDDRSGQESFSVQDKLTGDQIEFDGVQMGITIKATAALILKADGLVSIEGAMVQLQGRPVLPGTKPI